MKDQIMYIFNKTKLNGKEGIQLSCPLCSGYIRISSCSSTHLMCPRCQLISRMSNYKKLTFKQKADLSKKAEMFKLFFKEAAKAKNLGKMVYPMIPIGGYVNEIYKDFNDNWCDDDLVEWIIYFGGFFNISRTLIERALICDDINDLPRQYPLIHCILVAALKMKYKQIKEKRQSRFGL